MTKTQILIVEDDAGLREALTDTLELGGYKVIAAENAETALVMLNQHAVDLVVSDIQMGDMSGLSLLRSIKSRYPNLPVLLMTAFATINDAVQAMRDGATDYLSKPFAPQVLLNLVGRYAPAQQVVSRTPIVGDPNSEALLELSGKVAKTDATVMVLGPSGSGKEVLSRYIHDVSNRASEAFVAINCAAIPENMLEATLFGYEKGAFTGAIQACPGKFEQAQKGTLLLDEITEMDMSLQAKLLRVLQEKEVERLGARKTVSLDVRVIATSNRDLRQAVENGEFREDLYYRLNVFPIHSIPLRERMDDVPVLVRYFVEKLGKKLGKPITDIPQKVLDKLMTYSFPGNIRELENLIERAIITSRGNKLSIGNWFSTKALKPKQEDFISLELVQRQYIIKVLKHTNWKVSGVGGAAEILGMRPTTLTSRMEKLDIRRSSETA